MCFALGLGIEKNSEKAFELLTISAQLNDFYSQYYLGKCYEFGNMCNVDYKKAKYWYNCSLRNECDEALICLGDLYMDGKGVKVNYKKAHKLYKKAYERGADESQVAYAVSCLFDKNLQRVGFDLLKAMEGRDDYTVDSFLKLCYEKGIGTQCDDGKAKEIEVKLSGIKK